MVEVTAVEGRPEIAPIAVLKDELHLKPRWCRGGRVAASATGTNVLASAPTAATPLKAMDAHAAAEHHAAHIAAGEISARPLPSAFTIMAGLRWPQGLQAV